MRDDIDRMELPSTPKEPDHYVPKPPLGVMPREQFIWHRAEELILALGRYAKRTGPENLPVMKAWSTELADILKELEALHNDSVL